MKNWLLFTGKWALNDGYINFKNLINFFANALGVQAAITTGAKPLIINHVKHVVVPIMQIEVCPWLNLTAASAEYRSRLVDVIE